MRTLGRFWERYATLSLRRPTLLALVGLGLFVASMPGAIQLYANLHTDLRELLPQGAPAATALEELEKRLGGLSHLTVVVRTADLKAGERFVDAAAAKIQALPKTLVTRVQWKIDDERAYFEAHGALYAELPDLQAVDDGLRSRTAEANRKSNPLAVDLLDDPPAKDADAAAKGAANESAARDPAAEADAKKLDAAVLRIKDAFGKLDRFPDGYLAGEGGHTLLIMITPPGAAVSLDDDKAIFEAVKGAVDSLNPKSFDSSLIIGYAGEVRSVIEAQEALVRDLLLSSELVLVAVALALYLYYRSMRSIPLLVLPLSLGTAATFALSRATIHYLNPNTAFLGSIIVGNGINAGIILLARYLEERRRGLAIEDALPIALQQTHLATLAASGGAAASYASLMFVRFRGFNQFGFMGGSGMLLCWLATYFFMPPLIVLVERLLPYGVGGRHSRPTGAFAGPLARAIVRRPTAFVGLAAGLLVVSGLAIVRFARDPIQYDFTKLGSRQGAVDGVGMWNEHVDKVLESYQTPTVILTDTVAQAVAVADALEKRKTTEGSNTSIDSVQTLAKLVPRDQDAKLALLRDIVARLTPRVVDALPADSQPTVRRLVDKTRLQTVTLADVPAALKGIFQEKGGGTDGRLVLVYPTLETNSAHGREQARHAREVRAVAEEAAPGVRVAGQIVLTADIVSTITDDGLNAGLLSFFAVALLTFAIMRSVSHAGWVLGSLCLGVVWMFGALGAFHIKFNFVNFVVLPITFGIGVDYAVNLYQRYRESRGGVEEALTESGGAVALASSTTIIGYAALLVADNQAIQSFGLTAVIGEITCLSAALLALPSLLALRDSRRPPAPPVGKSKNGVPHGETELPSEPAHPRLQPPGDA